jgi:hypothetical protein
VSPRHADTSAPPPPPRHRRQQLFLARQWDASLPEAVTCSQLSVTDLRCSTAAADACSWLATAEARCGRMLEAEAHHKAAARAVEECGLVEACNRGVHALQHHRTCSKDWAKHKALLKSLNAGLAAAVAALAADTSRGDADVESTGPAAAMMPPLPPWECPQDVLTCACAVLHERVQGYMAQGKQAKAAALACGPLLLCAGTLEVAFPLRGRPGQAGVPLPPMSAPAVADMAAVLLATAGGVNTAHATTALLRLRVGFTALSLGYEGTAGSAAADSDDMAVPSCGGLMTIDARSLGLSDAWKTLLTAPAAATSSSGAPGKLTWLPERLLARLEAATELVLAAGEAWAPIRFNASPSTADDVASASSGAGGRSKRGSAAASEAQQAGAEAAQALSMVLLPYANVLMGGTIAPQQQPPPPPSPQERGVRAPLAARAARAAAAMCGAAKHAGNQGEALHMLGAALFYSAESAGEGGGRGRGKMQLLDEAASAFAASADAKRSCGAEAGGPCGSAQEAQATAGLCESLLFLGKISWDLGRHESSEDACARALVVARSKLGDRHVVTQKALSVMVDTKKKREALASL